MSINLIKSERNAKQTISDWHQKASKYAKYCVVFSALSCFTLKADIVIEVRDIKGQAVENAVISIPNLVDSPSHQATSLAVMDQIDMQFKPHVLVVSQGQEVSFPNSDDIRHHVYSFSSAKAFEIKLYKGVHSEKLTMNKPGIVELGCNIHDTMLGFIYVDATNSAVKTDAKGQATLPRDASEIEVWHPRLALGKAEKVSFSIAEADHHPIQIELDILPAASEEQKNTFKRGFSRKFSAKGEQE